MALSMLCPCFGGVTYTLSSKEVRLRRRLSEGGFAIVELVTDVVTGSEYALKKVACPDELAVGFGVYDCWLCLSVCLSVLSVSVYLCLCLCLSVSLSLSVCVCVCVCLSVCMYVCLSLSLLVCTRARGVCDEGVQKLSLTTQFEHHAKHTQHTYTHTYVQLQNSTAGK